MNSEDVVVILGFFSVYLGFRLYFYEERMLRMLCFICIRWIKDLFIVFYVCLRVYKMNMIICFIFRVVSRFFIGV